MAKKIGLLLIVCIHFFIIKSMQFFPYPELLVYPYLRNVGSVPYAQILDQHFPGFLFFPINLASAGFSTPESLFVLHLAIVAGNHIMLFVFYRLISKKYSLLPNFFYGLLHPMFEGNVLWIDSIMGMLLLPSFMLTYRYMTKGTRVPLLLSALSIGFALLFKQVVLPIVIVLSLVVAILKNTRHALFYLLFSLLPMFGMFLYYNRIGVFPDFWYWTVTFNITVFSEMGRKYPTINEIIKMLIIFSPMVFIFRKSVLKFPSVFLSFVFLVCSLVFAYARFDMVHLQPALLFFVLFIAFLVREKKYYFIYLLIPVYLVFSLRYISSNIGNEIRFFSSQERELTQKIIQLKETDASIFAFGTTPHVYYLTQTRPPNNEFVFQFPWFMTVAEKRILTNITKDVPEIVIRDTTATTSQMNLIEYMPAIQDYIELNYTLIDTIGTVEILKLNEN